MDKASGGKAIIAAGAHFKGKIKHTHAIEINGSVEADLESEKVTIGKEGNFVGAINADLVVISGHYDGSMNAGSIWATATAHISGKIQYKTLQMDRGAALNCRVVHNWKPETPATKTPTAKTPAAKTSATKKSAKEDAQDKATDAANRPDDDDKANDAGTVNHTETMAASTDEGAVQAASTPKHNDDTSFPFKQDETVKMMAPDTESPPAAEQQDKPARRFGIFGFASKSAG